MMQHGIGWTTSQLHRLALKMLVLIIIIEIFNAFNFHRISIVQH